MDIQDPVSKHSRGSDLTKGEIVPSRLSILSDRSLQCIKRKNGDCEDPYSRATSKEYAAINTISLSAGQYANQIMRELLVIGDVVQSRPSSQEPPRQEVPTQAPPMLEEVAEKGIFGRALARSMSSSTAVINRLLGRASSAVQLAPSMPKYSNGFSAFLATCKQARQEGSQIFCDEITVYIPPGLAEDMGSFLDSLRYLDRNLRPTIVLKMSLADLPLKQCLKLLDRIPRCTGSPDTP